MNFRTLSQLFNFRDIRNTFLKTAIVFGGLIATAVAFWANRGGDGRLAGIAAAVSLGFVLLILIFVVPPLVRSASAEASQMDLPFEFTTGGAIYLGLLAIVGFAAYNTGNNLLFIIMAFLTSAFLIGFIAGNFCLKKLDVKMRFPETIFAGEPTPLIVGLNNRKRIFPTYSVITEVRGKEREKSSLFDEIRRIIPAKIAERILRPPILKHALDYFIYIPRRTALENKSEHVFNHRGRFIIKDFELSTKFPFGFFRHRRRLSAQEAEIVIFPKIEPVETEILQLPFETGRRVLPRKGAGQDLLALRDYQPHDDLRHVDWKATARARRMIIREFSAEDERRVTVVFDTRLQLSANEKSKSLRTRIAEEQKGKKLTEFSKRFDKGVSLTASLLAHFNDERAEMRLIIDDESGEFGMGRTHLNDCLKRLALIEPTFYEADETNIFDETFEDIVSARRNSYAFVVTTQEKNLPDEINRQAKVLKY